MSNLVKNSQRSSRMQPSWYNPLNRFFKSDFMELWDEENPMTVPSINISEGKNNFKIELAAPGLKKEDFNIEMNGNLLTISSERESETKSDTDDHNFSHREYNYSSFSRSFSLPDNADSSRISAKYADGVLRLDVPKKADGQKNANQKIKVE